MISAFINCYLSLAIILMILVTYSVLICSLFDPMNKDSPNYVHIKPSSGTRINDSEVNDHVMSPGCDVRIEILLISCGDIVQLKPWIYLKQRGSLTIILTNFTISSWSIICQWPLKSTLSSITTNTSSQKVDKLWSLLMENLWKPATVLWGSQRRGMVLRSKRNLAHQYTCRRAGKAMCFIIPKEQDTSHLLDLRKNRIQVEVPMKPLHLASISLQDIHML